MTQNPYINEEAENPYEIAQPEQQQPVPAAPNATNVTNETIDEREHW